ncbi:hypothetical protein DB346_19355 [Verrucomicrobia bacterium LW23]|nr:hypothetical protein DB346_19355 [Verrucomicrobia bacterium LW23]
MNSCITPYNTATASQPVQHERFVRPAHDFNETADAYILTANVPGVSKETLETVVQDQQLVITGRKGWKAPEGAISLIREIRPNDYRISLRLDHRVDSTRIRAELRNGVLTVTLPKAEAAKPRHITIEG